MTPAKVNMARFQVVYNVSMFSFFKEIISSIEIHQALAIRWTNTSKVSIGKKYH